MCRDPMGEVGGALYIVKTKALGGTKDEYLEAIRLGLASDVDFAKLYHLNHSDATARAFLRAVEADLLAGTPAPR
ncbi:hypothetical protein AKJ09_10972 [Labilithrix luteola]|uniref:Uncharacterized protein n=2 Tax=Labilithrix luteola TaxID=1391654 RepID=A0A0K1QEX0_9BACT|nr:hypothetical protein AKJ09_10972 [Labilithrix luteola]